MQFPLKRPDNYSGRFGSSASFRERCVSGRLSPPPDPTGTGVSRKPRRRAPLPALLPDSENPEIDSRAHGKITGAVGVELVAGTAGRTFGNEFRLHLAGGWIECDGIEIHHRIEQSRRLDEAIQGATLVVLLPEAVRSIGGVECRRYCSADDAHPRDAHAQAPDDVAHACLDGAGGGIPATRSIFYTYPH